MESPLLTQARHDYENYGTSALSDAEFDALTDSTSHVGSASNGTFKKVKHAKPMLSLKNAFTAQEVVDHLKGVDDIVGEFKFDGLSLSLTYEAGKLVKAVTRGDGQVGDDVTENAKQIASIPQVVSTLKPMEIRGEVLMTKKQFEALNAELAEAGEQVYSNPRNLAAGSLKLKDPAEVAKRGLTFYAYARIGEFSDTTQFETTGWLARMGFLTTDKSFSSKMCLRHPLNYVRSKIDCISENRDSLLFDIDGIVFKANSLKVQQELGEADKFPNWAVAYKFPPTQVKTKVLEIKVQVGRQGTLTPVAEVVPVNLGGAMVKRATLCNIEEIQRLGINVGSEVLIARAADVIPKIYSCTAPSTPWEMPTECPSCHQPVVKDGSNTFCHNKLCPDQIFARLRHAFSKGALDVDGCGEAMIQQLMDMGAQTISECLRQTELSVCSKVVKGHDVVLSYKPDTSVQAKKVLAGFKTCINQPFWRKLNALGIELIGQTKCKDIGLKYGNDINAVMHAPLEELTMLLGPIAASNFSKFIDDNVDELCDLGALGFWFQPEEKKTVQSGATGKQFVITGTLTSGSREEVAALIESHGGVVKGGVNKKVDYLVVGFSPGAGKTGAAEKYGTKTLTEEALYDLMGIAIPVPRTFGEDEL